MYKIKLFTLKLIAKIFGLVVVKKLNGNIGLVICYNKRHNKEITEILYISRFQHLEFINRNPNLKSISLRIANDVYALWINYNQLTHLPDLPSNLETLFCNDNKLITLPNELPIELKVLSCDKNNIQKLPDLTQCTKLEFVDCDLVCFESYMLGLDIEFDFYY